jgi:D-alanyl-D-alanine carboxypeptidase (penicillin-binding protein 5/6)
VPRLRFDQYLSLLLVGVSLFFVPSFNQVHQLSAQAIAVSLPKVPTGIIHSTVVPVYTGSDPLEQQLTSLTASAIYVMDKNSGAILFHKDDQLGRYPASTAKMMTALVSRRIYPLDKVLTVQEEAFTTGTTAKLQLGEKLTVGDLLKALLIPSGNDAALVLANHHQFGYQGFVDQMNQMAKEFHLEHTTFGNASGLDIEGQNSTARDLAILAKEVMKDSFLREVVGTRHTTITDQSGTISHPLTTTQELLGVVEGVVGIKTGTTDFAGENLITEVDRNGHQVIIVVLGSQDRFVETRQVIDWVFQNYEWRYIIHS